jgi:hypothetical protein
MSYGSEGWLTVRFEFNHLPGSLYRRPYPPKSHFLVVHNSTITIYGWNYEWTQTIRNYITGTGFRGGHISFIIEETFQINTVRIKILCCCFSPLLWVRSQQICCVTTRIAVEITSLPIRWNELLVCLYTTYFIHVTVFRASWVQRQVRQVGTTPRQPVALATNQKELRSEYRHEWEGCYC